LQAAADVEMSATLDAFLCVAFIAKCVSKQHSLAEQKWSARSPRSAAGTTSFTKPNNLYGHVSKKVVRFRHTRADNHSTIATAVFMAAATSSTPFCSKKRGNLPERRVFVCQQGLKRAANLAKQVRAC
jgi:hypothetical protein